MDTTTPLISQDSANNESATETGSEALSSDMVDKGTKLLDVLPMQTEFFLDLVNTNYSQETVDNYKRDLEILAAFILSNKLAFVSLKKLDISRYVEFLRTGRYLTVLKKYKPTNVYGKAHGTSEKKKSSSSASRRLSMYSGRLSSRSVNRMLSAIRSYLRFLIDIDHQVPLPPDSIKLIKSEKKETQVAEFEELVHLVEAPETYEKKRKIRFRNRAMLEMLFSTGMRISELINLDRHDLKLTDNSHLGDSKI
ncbi:tyrosine-type recombinase/integrase, partial [Candidatus Dojkabacteria bacterium]|nr:tyrosine-type recombinase/integrase [Candidatus Dojkabacteria bacterium]